MEKWHRRLKSRCSRIALWIALCFALTSGVYLSWVYRLVNLAGGAAADWASMVAGYLAQAAGMGLTALALRRLPRAFGLALLAYSLAFIPSLLSDSAAGAIAFGLVANLGCGVIAGFYLFAVAAEVRTARRSLAFGGGYAIATVAIGLLALPANGDLLDGRYAPPLFLALALATGFVTARLKLFGETGEAPAEPAGPPESLALACAAVGLISLVKNLGFAFPSADIVAGLRPELSRIPYAIGLLAAGFIGDRSRKNSLICAVAALILPFIMLGVTGEPVSGAICWGLDYLFYGFFSVFRAVLLLDLAARTRRWELAPLGLLVGRLGDAAGTAVCLLLADHRLPLIAVTALLFFPAAFLCYRLYQRLYEPSAERQRSEREVFEAFCLHNDLSSRERDVLRMLIDSRTNGEIAEALFITESTVKYHVHNILQKTGCRNRSELQKKFTASLFPHLADGPALRTPEA